MKRPTVRQVVEALSALPDDELIATLGRKRELMQKAAVADARGHAPERLSTALRHPDCVEAWYLALREVVASLHAKIGYERARNDGQPTRASKAAAREAERVDRRIPEARELLAGPKEQRTPEDLARAVLRRAHKDWFHQRLETELAKVGLPLRRPVRVHVKDAGAWLLETGRYSPTGGEVELMGMPWDEFRFVVGQDVNGVLDHDLRGFSVLDRWEEALVELETAHDHEPPAADELAQVRRSRFRQALMDRRGEVRRAKSRRVREAQRLVDAANQEPVRRRAMDRVYREMQARWPEEFTSLLQEYATAS